MDKQIQECVQKQMDFVSKEIRKAMKKAIESKPDVQDEGDYLRWLVRGFLELMEAGDFATCDRLLAGLDLERMPALLQIGILQTTFSVKDELKEWDGAFNRINLSLAARGVELVQEEQELVVRRHIGYVSATYKATLPDSEPS